MFLTRMKTPQTPTTAGATDPTTPATVPVGRCNDCCSLAAGGAAFNFDAPLATELISGEGLGNFLVSPPLVVALPEAAHNECAAACSLDVRCRSFSFWKKERGRREA